MAGCWAGLGGHSVLSPAVSILGPALSGHHLGARLRVLVTLLCNDSSFGNVINASGNGDIVAGCWLGWAAAGRNIGETKSCIDYLPQTDKQHLVRTLSALPCCIPSCAGGSFLHKQ